MVSYEVSFPGILVRAWKGGSSELVFRFYPMGSSSKTHGFSTRSFCFPQPPRKDPFLVAMLSREFSGVWCLLARISSRGGEEDDSATAESNLTHIHHPKEVEPASLVTLVPSPASSRTRCGMVSKHPWLIHLGKKLEMCSGLVMGCLRGFLLNYSS